MTETMAIAASARSPNVLASSWDQVDQACYGGVAMMKNDCVGGSWVQILVQAKFFMCESNVFKELIDKISIS